MSTFYDLPELGREVSLFTHYAQKEDSVSLYGFLREAERRLFRDVQKVTGIGAKIALDLLRSEEHTSELQSLMRISYAVFCLKKKKKIHTVTKPTKTYLQFTQTKLSKHMRQDNTNIQN